MKDCGGLGLASMATLILNTKAAGEDPFVLDKVQKADAIFFAGERVRSGQVG